MTRREMYEAGTVCRNPTILHDTNGKSYYWDEPCRYLFSRGPYPTVQGGEIGEAGPVKEEFWYEEMGHVDNARFYTDEPLPEWDYL